MSLSRKTILKYSRQNTRPTEDLAWENVARLAKIVGMTLGEYLTYCAEVDTFMRDQSLPKIRVCRSVFDIPRSVGQPLHAVRIGDLGLENY